MSLKKILLTFTTPILVTIFVAVGLFTPVSADDGFNPGRIIDDVTFTDSNTMNASQIQQFLNSKAPSCDTWGVQPSEFGGGTRAQWGTSRGTPPPFICLKDYVENNKSAAQIIYDASQEFSINPQVLIVLLQKEQGLVTDTWPLPIQYRSATGYACSDTAACDSQYYGLTNQVRWASRMFRAIMNASPTWFTPYVVGNNYIRYNTDTSCGGTVVNITNRATQALYNYTPYQPNPATLNAAMGVTVTCGAYGNINFYRYMDSWFGTRSIPTSNVVVADGVYNLQNVNSGKMLNISGGNPTPGTKIQIFDNDGTASNWWDIKRDIDGYYTFRNLATGNYIDVTGGNFSKGTLIQSWSGNGTCSQKWALVYQNNSYKLLSKCSGLALDVIKGGTANGTGLQIWSNNVTPAQDWRLLSHRAPPVNDGFYSISSATNMALDVVGAQTTPGTPTQIYTPNNSPAQIWQFIKQSDGTFSIRNPISNRYLYVPGDTTVTGTVIQIHNPDSSCAWKWNIITNSDDSVTLASLCSGMVIDIRDGAVSTPGTPIQTWLQNNTNAQHWTLKPIDGSDIPVGTYSIRSVANLALDITGGNLIQGTKTQLWSPNGLVPQQWNVVKQADNTYSIINPASGLYIDLTGGSLNSGTQAQVWSNNSTCAQKWNIQKNFNLTYTFKSACSNVALDISGGRIGSMGANIQAWTLNGTPSQQWLFGNP